MPTYEYECRACGHTLEAFQSFSEKPLRKCPKCKKMKLQRLIGAGAGIIFKGSGFHETDYRSSDYKERAKKESGDSGSSGDSASSTPSSETSDSSGSKSACGPCKSTDCSGCKK